MNEATKRLYLQFVEDRIQSAMETAQRGAELAPLTCNLIESDLQAALEKLREVLEREGR